MVVGLGLDVTELSRVEAVFARHGERFAERVLTEAERAAMPARSVAYLASRFAAKEAGVKALGTGFSQGITFKDVEVGKDNSGKPQLRFHGQAARRALELRVTRIHLSLTHGRDVAAAVVVLEAP